MIARLHTYTSILPIINGVDELRNISTTYLDVFSFLNLLSSFHVYHEMSFSKTGLHLSASVHFSPKKKKSFKLIATLLLKSDFVWKTCKCWQGFKQHTHEAELEKTVTIVIVVPFICSIPVLYEAA